MAGSGFFAPLAQRQFRLLFSGQVLSGFGDWIDYVALVSLVAYRWHDGAGGLAAVSIAAALPWIVLAPLAGVWADRLPQRRAMIGCDLLRAALVLCYLAAPNLPLLLVLLLAKTSVGTLFAPAQQSALTRIVPTDRLLAANSLSAFVNQVSKVAGPAVGGVILAVTNAHTAFVVDAATFLGSAAILSGLRMAREEAPAAADATAAPADPTAAPADRQKPSFRAELTQGFAFVLRSRVLLTAIGSLSATILLVLAFDTLSPLVLTRLGLGHDYYGPTLAAVAAGAVAGTFLVGTYGQRWNGFTVLAVSQAATGLLVAGVGAVALAHDRMAPAVWLPVAVGIGLCSTGILVVFQYLVQRATPHALMGRVTAVVSVVPTVLQIAAPLLGAALAVAVGLGWVLAAAGAGLALLGGVFLWRRPADAPEQDAPEQDAPEQEASEQETADRDTPDQVAPDEHDTPSHQAEAAAVRAPRAHAAEAPHDSATAAPADAGARQPVPAGHPATDASPAAPGLPERHSPWRSTDMSYNALEALAASGHTFEGASEAQLAVISSLTEEEVAVMNSIKARLDGEVAAHEAVSQPGSTVGGFVW